MPESESVGNFNSQRDGDTFSLSSAHFYLFNSVYILIVYYNVTITGLGKNKDAFTLWTRTEVKT